MRRNRISRRDNRPSPTTYAEAFKMKGTYAVKQMRIRREKSFKNRLAKLQEMLENAITEKLADIENFSNFQEKLEN